MSLPEILEERCIDESSKYGVVIDLCANMAWSFKKRRGGAPSKKEQRTKSERL